MALREAGFRSVFANDIDPNKRDIYALNFDAEIYVLSDIRMVRGSDVPSVHLATASFPCTDLSLAGNRAGLKGTQSGLLGEFFRVIEEMAERRPGSILIENVPGFASSHKGNDIRYALHELNRLGYACDVLALDAKRFLPQSRLRLFIVGTSGSVAHSSQDWSHQLRPSWFAKLQGEGNGMRLQAPALPLPPLASAELLDEFVEEMGPTDERWWEAERLDRFLSSLSEINSKRLSAMVAESAVRHATAYRRTRSGTAVWEIRDDGLAGCLRTARGGSSRQALVAAGGGHVRVRWMTAREYARLQGAPQIQWGSKTENQAKFAMGDAVCVPAVAWIANNYLAPVVADRRAVDAESKSGRPRLKERTPSQVDQAQLAFAHGR